jgi:hypothetical protein
MAKLIAGCLALAGISLLLPSEPSYDPWAWLVWGRELAHGGLDTTGGPSWKPLPVAFTTLVARLEGLDEGLPVALWMVVARAGALLALAMAFRLASRLAGGGLPGAIGGAVAAVALVLTPDWFQFTAHGSEAPIAVALMLWAIERQLDGRPGQVVVLGTLASLLRPELFPFLALYGLWAWRAEPRLRPLLAGVVVLLPAAWILPEWIGSGNPLDGGKQARSEPVWSLSHAEHSWLRALERVHNHAGLAPELLAVIALVWALVRRCWAVVALGAAAMAEVAVYMAMTESGFSGNPRYVLPALAVASVLAGVGAAVLVESGAGLAGWLARPRRLVFSRPALLPRLAGGAAGLAVVAALGTSFLQERGGQLRSEARQVERRMDIHRDLARAVDKVGGPDAIAATGTATANRALHSRLAWELGVPMDLVESVIDHRVVFRSRNERLNGGVYLRGRAKVRETMVRVGGIRVYRREGITFPVAARARREWTEAGLTFNPGGEALTHLWSVDGEVNDGKTVGRTRVGLGTGARHAGPGGGTKRGGASNREQ